MPYGAAVRGDLRGLKAADEIKILLTGPLFSLLLAALTAALWWFYPNTYPYTEQIFLSNLSLFLINLLPAYPLDGGRILRRILNEKYGTKRGGIISEIISSLTVLAVSAAGIFTRNFSACLLSVMLLCGIFTRGEYVPLPFPPIKALLSGVEIRKIAASRNLMLCRLFKFLSPDKILSVEVYSENGDYLFTARQQDIEKLFLSSGPYALIGEIHK